MDDEIGESTREEDVTGGGRGESEIERLGWLQKINKNNEVVAFPALDNAIFQKKSEFYLSITL